MPANAGSQASQLIGKKRIVVGVGPESRAADAARLADVIARVTRAEVTLVAVRPPAAAGAPGIGQTEAEVRARMQYLRALIAPEASTTLEHDHSVTRGLSRAVAREQTDLLVLGSSRRASEGRVRIGGRTRQLLADAPCPVAVALCGLYPEGPQRLTAIGVGYDGTPDSGEALSRAQSLAHAAGAKLRVRAVADDRLPYVGWTPTGGPDLYEISDAVVEPRVESLRKRAESAVAGTDAVVEVEPGCPPDSLIALSRDVDLLVIGSEHWGVLPRETTGEGVMRQAHCSVMVVPRPSRSGVATRDAA